MLKLKINKIASGSIFKITETVLLNMPVFWNVIMCMELLKKKKTCSCLGLEDFGLLIRRYLDKTTDM